MAAADVFAEIIEHLEHVRKRPMMYAGDQSEQIISAYLSGFQRACELCGYCRDEDVFWTICAERGWELNSLGPQKHMRDQGWSEEAIVDEILVIEIETWKRMATRLAEPVDAEKTGA